MSKTWCTLTCWLTLAPIATTRDVSAAPHETLRPNILIILADDMGYGDVGVLNRDGRILTPNLDRLATESLVFTDAHCSGSYCVPSRYGLLTGRYMWRTRLGSGGNLANFGGTLIEPGRKTLADLLQGAGYFTGLVGKWHQGIDWKLHDESAREIVRVHNNYQDFQNIDFASAVLKGPNDYGFDYSYATAGSAEMNPSTFIENNRVTIIPTPIVFNDMIPTLAEMLEIKLDNDTAEDGESFFKAISGEASPESFHEAIVHNHSNGTFAIRKGAFKLTVQGPKTTTQVLDDALPVSFVLHDLSKDIEETTDISDDHPQMVKEMHALLKKYVREGRSNGGLDNAFKATLGRKTIPRE